MKVLIYQNYVHNNYILYDSLVKSLGKENVDFVDAIGITHEHKLSFPKVSALFMPGGADLYYVEKLNGEGNSVIRSFVEGGGTYVGICAGSYYGASSLEWAIEEQDKEEHILGNRELAFFKGVAKGPVYQFLEDGDFQKQHSEAVKIVAPGIFGDTVFKVKYGGGPVFIPEKPDDLTCNVIARYDDLEGKPIAIVECIIGQGSAWLISPHIEESGEQVMRKTYHHHNKNQPRAIRIAEELIEFEIERRRLWEYVLDRISSKMTHESLTSGLASKWLGYPTIFYNLTDSTNVRAIDLVTNNSNKHHGTTIIAERQTAGRGTGGAKWISNNPNGMLLTLIIKGPSKKEPAVFLPAIAAVEMLRENFHIDAHVKWPNDILFERKKLGGILVEQTGGYFIIGIGLNVNQEFFDEEISHRAVSMFQVLGHSTPVEIVYQAFIKKFEDIYDGSIDLIQSWRKNTRMIGKTITLIRKGLEEEQVQVEDLSSEGFLLVKDSNGELQKIISRTDLDIDINY